MTFIIRYTHEAEAGIESNYVWWAEHRSPQQALDSAEAVERQVNGLRETASQCSRSREDGREGFPFPLFDKLVGLGRGNSHRAVFTIREDTVFVLSTSQRIIPHKFQVMACTKLRQICLALS